jgi:hypothetical protein
MSLNLSINSNQNFENVKGRAGNQNSKLTEKFNLNYEGYLDEVGAISHFLIKGGKTPTTEGYEF